MPVTVVFTAAARDDVIAAQDWYAPLAGAHMRRCVDAKPRVHDRPFDNTTPASDLHALRHTGATSACNYTHDLRAVQDQLGRADPRTAARYARVVDKALNDPAAAMPIRL